MQIIICLPCGKAISPGDLLGHYKAHFEKGNRFAIILKNLEPFEDQLAMVVEQYSLHSKLETQLNPPPFQAPVEGLKIVPGLCCTVLGCNFCCSPPEAAGTSSTTANQHFSKYHRDLKTPVRDRMQACFMQRLCHTTSYFPVIPQPPVLAPSAENLATAVKENILEHLASLDYPALSKKHNRDVPPLLSMTRWHIYLEPYYESKKCRNQIHQLVSLPKTNDEGYIIRGVAYCYLEKVRRKGVDMGFELMKPFGDG